MNEFDIVNVMNEAMIRLSKNKNKNCDENLEIQKSLEDRAYFFKISKPDAYNTLEKIGIRQESLEHVYEKLISKDVFYDLLNKGIINENDNNLVVKYDSLNGVFNND